ncbi:glutathione S-transferase T3-like [Helianthus annuus]|nr:glutathione S-transferase T3-like [Helianthus annuus]
MASEKWTKVQEEALAKALVHCSTNKKKGNQQNHDSFWRKILDHFNATVGGSKRTVHQVRSKWGPMMTKINFFNGLYQQADRTRGSGCKDLDVMKVALKEFKERFPNGFQHVEAWEVVRKHDKWAQVPLLGEEGEGSAQKRKPVDVDPLIPDMNEDPSPQRTQRRDKRQATSSEGSSAELAAQFKEWRVAVIVVVDDEGGGGGGGDGNGLLAGGSGALAGVGGGLMVVVGGGSAYYVLNDVKKRQIYDIYGEDGVKSGWYDEMSNAFTGVMKLGSDSGFGFDPRDVEMFAEFFYDEKSVKKAETVENKLSCRLEELYKGSKRKM